MKNDNFEWMPIATAAGISRKNFAGRLSGICATLLILCFFAAATSVYAQSTASLAGTVHDSQGAVVPSVSVSVRNRDTGFTRKVVTDASGNYQIYSLPIGPYTLTAELKNFKQAEVQNIVLQVAQQARVDVVLSPGNVQETVTVTDTVNLMQTDSSGVGQVIDQKQIVDLPLNSRHVTQLIALTPGALTSPVVGSGNGPNSGPGAGTNTGNTTATISGGQQKTEFVLDGLTNSENLYSGIQFEPSEDFVQEFRVLSNSFPAQYGRGSAVVLMSTKSGTNGFHGTAFEFIRLDTPGFRTDAKNYFAAPGTPLASLHQHQFGGALGGPVLKNRLFFFLNYDATRSSIPTTKSNLVPDANVRAGNLDSSLQGPAAVDPYTGNPFPTNSSGNPQVPANELDAAAQYFLNSPFIPLPNQPNSRYVYSPASTRHVDQGNARMDYRISDKDSVFGRFSITDSTSYSPGPFPTVGGVYTQVNAKNIAFGYTHIFSPRLLNEFHAGYGGFLSSNSPQNFGTNYTVKSGLLGFDQTSALFPGLPYFSMGSYATISGVPYSPLINPTQTYQLADQVIWTKGKHSFTMGLEMTRFHLTSMNPGPGARGEFFFSDNEYSHNGFVDFLTGLPNQGVRNFPRNVLGQKNFSSPMFIQDDWRVTPNLTVNVGLRYDLTAAPVADLAQNAYFDLKTGKFVVSIYKNGMPNLQTQGVAQDAYNIYAAYMETPDQAGLPNNLETMSKKTFAPRLGFAYRLFGNSKTVLRGGFGIFYDVMGGNQSVSSGFNNIPFLYDTSKVGPTAGPGNYTPVAGGNWENFFNYTFGTGGGATLSEEDLKIHPPYSQEWNLAIQRELTGSMALTVAYVGNKGTHEEQYLPINYPVWVNGVNKGAPWPQFGEGDNSTNIGNSEYHALQTTLEKRYSHGLQLLSTFTWAKYIDEGSWDEDNVPGESLTYNTGGNPADIRTYRGLGAEDVKLRSVTSAVYALPFGRGMQFGSHISRPLDYLLGGWRVSVIATMQSGSPFTPKSSTVPFGNGANYGNLPNRIGSGKLAHPTIQKWFDPTAFVGVPNNTGIYGNSGRNILRGPGEDIWDGSLFKDLHYSERAYLELRLDTFNAFNHPWFGQPVQTIQSSTAGQITSTAVSTNSRELQGSIKVYF